MGRLSTWSASFIGEDSLVDGKTTKSVSPSAARKITKLNTVYGDLQGKVKI